MPRRYYRVDQIIDMLWKEKGDSSWAALAKKIGISRAYMSDLIRDKRNPGPTVLKFLGVEEVQLFQPKLYTLNKR